MPRQQDQVQWQLGPVVKSGMLVEGGVVRERGGRFKATHRARANSTQVNEYSEACENCGERGLGASGDLSWKRPGEMVQITGNIQISPLPLCDATLLLLRIRVITTAAVRASYVSRKIAVCQISIRKSRFIRLEKAVVILTHAYVKSYNN